MRHSFFYDIRTSQDALNTLVNFTGVVPPIWDKNFSNRSKFYYDDELIEYVISKHGNFPPDYMTWIFVYFHITTSANECESFNKHGILDLKKTYECKDSELRAFLDSRGIFIDLYNQTLSYKNRKFDISYGKCPPQYLKKEYACWSVGRKFYYDYTTCGFLSISDNSPYGGYVHFRPEILFDIDNLLNLTLSQEWHLSHRPFEITAMVEGKDIIYDGDDNISNRQKTLDYITRAYYNAFGATTEEIVLLKSNIQVPPQKIIDIQPFNFW